MKKSFKFVDFTVRIPNLDGDEISETHVIKAPVTIDPYTGEELLTEKAVALIDNTKARYMGLLLPEQIKEMRLRLRLTQKQISQLLQAGGKSYTRWESGRARPSRIVNVLLRLLYDGTVTTKELSFLSQPKRSNGATTQRRVPIKREKAEAAK